MGYKCCLQDLGLIDYRQAYLLQRQAIGHLKDTGIQSIFLCEHPVVITLGRMARKENLLVSEEHLKVKGVDLIHVNRGGDITLHAPGQLVIYPIFNLTYYGKDLHKYLHKLEQTIIDLLGYFDIVADRIYGKTGVWIRDAKIASIGIGVKHWISFHGVALNVDIDISLFFMIKPCGMEVRMTAMNKLMSSGVDKQDIKEKLISCFEREFDLNYI